MNGLADEQFSKYVMPNAVTNVVCTAMMALAGILLVPYYIGEMGMGAYGLLPLVTTITYYVIIITDELTKAFSRYLIISIHENDTEKSNSIYTTTIRGLGRSMLMMFPLVVLVAIASPYVFQTGDIPDTSVQLLFLMVLSSALIMSFSTCLNGIFMACNKLYIIHIARLMYTTLQLILIVSMFSAWGPDLEYIGVAYLVSAAIFFVLLFFMAKRINPDLSYQRRLYDGKMLKEMGELGTWSIISRIGMLLFIQVSLFLVNIFMGNVEGGSFSLIVTMISITNTACITVTTVVAPILYKSYANKDMESLIKISRLSMKLIGLLIAYPIAYFCMFSTQVLDLLGNGEFLGPMEIVPLMFSVQVGVCAISVLEVIPILFLRIKPVAVVTILVGLINVLSAAALLNYTDMGVMTVAIVWVITMFFLNFIFYPIFVAKVLSHKPHSFLTPLVPGYLALIGCVVVGYVTKLYYTMPSTWATVIIPFAVLFIMYLAVIWKFGFNKSDKSMIAGVLPSFMRKYLIKQTS
ncbi:MAG: hypothetical protein LBM39_03135 [Candidatus Methanoplasma sp.]|nr:hypothetical protein [Candidatus Methanoplasma sp.]